MRIPSGVTDQYIYFVAVDATDFATRETGLSSFTVYRSRNGAASAAMTPTINETDSTNMPGVYELLLDEDMTIGSGNDSEEMVFHITATGMAPVTRTIELYRPKITAGNTLDVTSTGAAGIDWGNVENVTTTVSFTNTTVSTVSTLTGHTAQTGDSFARLGSPAGASVSADIAAIEAQTDDIGVAGAGLSAIPWNPAWDAEVQSEVADGLAAYNAVATTDLPTNFSDLSITVSTGLVDVNTNNDKTGYSISGAVTTLDSLNDLSAAEVNTQVDTALADIHLDHLLAADYDPASKPGTATALLNELVENDGGVSRFTANALEQGSIAAANAVLNAGQLYEQNQTANIYFIMVDSTDHITREDSLLASSPIVLSVERSIDGGAFASGTGTFSHLTNGIYEYAASTADMNGQDIIFRFTATGADEANVIVRTYTDAA